VTTATVQPPLGCTLAGYAEAKRLPLELLAQLGLTEQAYLGRRAVRIPYLDPAGNQAAVRYRVALQKTPETGGAFRWQKGTKPIPYGLWRLDEGRRQGHVVLVEGESDTQTLWLHGVPALGIPGAGTWNAGWARYLDGIPAIFAVVEPDAGGEAFLSALAASGFRDRVRLISLAPVKDPSALYLADPCSFPGAWRAAMDAATPLTLRIRVDAEARHRGAWERCSELAQQADILGCFAAALAQTGFAGEERAAKLVYLCVTSRFLERPVSAAIKGPSAAGKSYLVERVLAFFPGAAYYALSAMSERALAYSAEPLVHRFLVLYEAAGLDSQMANYFVRSLLSEGRLRYETVDKTRDGMKPRLIEREGPTGLLLTTTALHLHPENETRLFSIPVTDSAEQTRLVMLELAADERAGLDLNSWHALQEWLAGGEHRVTIPFATELAHRIPPAAVRLRRDFGAVLNLIRAHALLHQAHRERDGRGRIVASLDDYAAVRALVGDLVAEGLEMAVGPAIRETVDAVRLAHNPGEGVTVLAVANQLGLDKSAASRRVRAARDLGYLKNLEERRGRPARLAIGEPLPDNRELMPRAEDLGLVSGCTVAADPGGTEPAPVPPRPNPAQQASTHAPAGAHPLAGELEPEVLKQLMQRWEPVALPGDLAACPGSLSGCTVAARGTEPPPVPGRPTPVQDAGTNAIAGAHPSAGKLEPLEQLELPLELVSVPETMTTRSESSPGVLETGHARDSAETEAARP
jgi:hypothetical protein